MNKLRGLRVAKGLTQEDMADILGISKQTYNQKEQGKSEFKTSEINIILDLFDDENYENIFLDAS